MFVFLYLLFIKQSNPTKTIFVVITLQLSADFKQLRVTPAPPVASYHSDDTTEAAMETNKYRSYYQITYGR